MRFLIEIISFFKNLFSKGKTFFWRLREIQKIDERKKESKYIGEFVDDLSFEDEVEENVIYVIGENGFEWLVAFYCPCGCGELIQLNLLESGKNVWRIISSNPKKISIVPSINRNIGCRSHFTITDGEVIWWEKNFIESN